MLSLILFAGAAFAHAIVQDSRHEKRAFSVEFPSDPHPDFPGPLPWPRNTINYCFKDQNSQDKLQDLVESGFRLWENAPGGIGGITMVLDQPAICSAGTRSLQISAQQGKVEASGAYYKAGKINALIFDPEAKPITGTLETSMAHELGHVLGLLHEHQRPDAANHVKFNCENLSDYKKLAKDRTKAEMNQLCTSRALAGRNGFSAAQFIPYGIDANNPTNADGDFDFDSIMIYESLAGSKRPTGPFKKDVLVRKDNGDRFFRKATPSAVDTARVRAMYAGANGGGAAVQALAESFVKAQSGPTFTNTTSNATTYAVIDDSAQFLHSDQMTNSSMPTSGLMTGTSSIPSATSSVTPSATPSIVQESGCDGPNPDIEACDEAANNDPNRVICHTADDCNDYCEMTIGNTPDVQKDGLSKTCIVIAPPGESVDDAPGSCQCYPTPDQEIEEFVMAIGEMACIAVDEALNMTATVLSWVVDVATENPKSGEEVQEIFKAGETYFAKGSTLGNCANVACPGHEMTVVNMTDIDNQLGALAVC